MKPPTFTETSSLDISLAFAVMPSPVNAELIISNDKIILNIFFIIRPPLSLYKYYTTVFHILQVYCEIQSNTKRR